MYRKFSAAHIFTGYQMLNAGEVLITDTNGRVIEMVAPGDAGDEVMYLNGIITPGFINTHCHLELSHLKGRIQPHTGLVDFVFKIMGERHGTEDEILSAIEKADKDMQEGGIVAVGDICNTAFTIAQKQKSNTRYYNFIEVSGFPPAVAKIRFEKSLAVYHQFKTSFSESAIVPHAPYSVSPSLFALIDNFYDNKVVTIHNQEAIAENELFQFKQGDFLRLFEKLNLDISFFKPSGKTSLQTCLPYLNNYQSLILVHNVYTSKEDIAYEKKRPINTFRNTFYCLCPNANLYISQTLPDVDALTQAPHALASTRVGSNIVLGTDSLASNGQLSILEEMKTLQTHFPQLSTESLLQWATINGARALQMDKELGSFEKGKMPGIVLIENAASLSFSKDCSAKRIL